MLKIGRTFLITKAKRYREWEQGENAKPMQCKRRCDLNPSAMSAMPMPNATLRK
jgi:hypothetical protein